MAGVQEVDVDQVLEYDPSDIADDVLDEICGSASSLNKLFSNQRAIDALFASTYFQQKLLACLSGPVGSQVAKAITR